VELNDMKNENLENTDEIPKFNENRKFNKSQTISTEFN